MSYGFMTFAVDVEKLKSVCGSKDEKLVRMIGGRFKRNIQSYDEDVGDDDGPKLKEALQQIVDGAELNTRFGATYGYAFKLLCEHFGKFLPNAALLPIRSSFMDAVDSALKAMGVSDAVSLARFAYRGAPVKLPSPDDFPMIGYLTAEEVVVAKERLDAAAYQGDDSDVREAIDAIKVWLRVASERKQGLVAFYH